MVKRGSVAVFFFFFFFLEQEVSCLRGRKQHMCTERATNLQRRAKLDGHQNLKVNNVSSSVRMLSTKCLSLLQTILLENVATLANLVLHRNLNYRYFRLYEKKFY